MTTKRLTILFVIFLVISFLYQQISRRIELDTLKTTGVLTTGHTLSFRNVFRSGNRVTYKFIVNGRTCREEDERTELDEHFFNEFKNKNFPVIYNPKHPKTNKILLTKGDFKKFNIAVPDSLKEVISKTE